MKLSIVSVIIRFIAQFGCLALMVVGIWNIFGNSIKNMFREEQRYRRLEKTVSAKKLREQNFLVEYIRKVLSTVHEHEAKQSEAYIFIAVSIVIFIFSFLISIKIFSLAISLCIALMIAVFPYMLVRVKLRSVRIDSSYDADTLATSITNEYKQHNFNMITAIENCAVRFDIGSYSRRILYRLSLALKDYKDEEELDRALAQFVYSYDTEWAVLLRANIKMSVHRGIDVSSGLEDILKKLKDIREQIEVSKRYNSETLAMIRFLLVPLYLGSIYMAVKTFGFTLKKFFEYQFLNVVGLRMGIIMFLSIMISFIALMLIRKPKYDI